MPARRAIARAMFAAAFGGWIWRAANLLERVVMGLGGAALLYADLRLDAVGFGLLALGVAIHLFRARRIEPAPA